MIRISIARRVEIDGWCEREVKSLLIATAWRCCTYDLSTANPINPQGTAGGGNVFNAAPIFGNENAAGSSEGSDGASTASSDTSALGTAVGGSASQSTGGTSFWSQYGDYFLIGLGVLATGALAIFGVHILRKRR